MGLLRILNNNSMKIKRVELKNHLILGNFIFDFSVDGLVRNFSILVAENGCGKTIFLDEIHKILSNGFTLWGDGVNRKVIIEFNDIEKTSLELPTNIITIDYDETKTPDNSWSRFSIFDANSNDVTGAFRPQIQNNGSLNKLLKCAYSTVEINFTKKDIDAIKATTIDHEESTKNKSTPEIATEIAQLLVDIKNQDNAEKAIYFDDGKSNNDLKYKGKFDRFKEAYAKLFDGKELLDVRVNDNKYEVVFRDSKKNVEFDIFGLSSGEKQVVYRVGYLLRNLRGLNGGLVIIDEPELSLHPKWQEKYLQFLRDVFFTTTDVNMQFIIATHSPLLLKDALNKDVSVHILKKSDTGEITVTNAQENGFGLLKWSPSWGEICFFAYGLTTIEFHDDLYSAIEDGLKRSSTDRISQVRFEDYIAQKRPNIVKIKWPDLVNGPEEETIMTFVRNSIHHPDNTDRPAPSPELIKESVMVMLDLIKNP